MMVIQLNSAYLLLFVAAVIVIEDATVSGEASKLRVRHKVTAKRIPSADRETIVRLGAQPPKKTPTTTDVVEHEDVALRQRFEDLIEKLRGEPETKSSEVHDDSSHSKRGPLSSGEEFPIWEESDYGDDCVFSFQTEDDIDGSLETAIQPKNVQCFWTSTIVQKSEVHPKALIPDGNCRFDPTQGYWYTAECVVDDEAEPDIEPGHPIFVWTKAFCSAGCQRCADPEELPGPRGRLMGSLYKARKNYSYGVCELPAARSTEQGRVLDHHRAPSYVQYVGNCVKQTCKDTEDYLSTMTYIE